MTDVKLRLHVKQLYADAIGKGRVKNIQAVYQGMRNGEENEVKKTSYATVRKWINDPDSVNRIDLPVLMAFLQDGIGLTPEQIGELRLSDIFEFIK